MAPAAPHRAGRLRLASLAVAAIVVAGTPAAAQQRDTTRTDSTRVRVGDLVVTGRKGSYAVDSIASGRTTTPLYLQPQGVSVLTRTLLDEQQLRTLTDAVANVAGVIPNKPSETVLVNPIVRGFPSEIYVDGLPAYGTSATVDPSSLAGVERIEVAKGPASFLYAGGSGAPLGGLINIVPTSPSGPRRGSMLAEGGMYGTARAVADLHQPLAGDRVGLHLGAEVMRGDSHIDAVNQRRVNVAPSLRWAPDARTSLTLRGQYTRTSQLEYSGLPGSITVENPGLGVSPFRFSGATDAPPTVVTNRFVSARLERQLAPRVRSALAARWYRNTFDEFGSFIFGDPLDPAAPTEFRLLTATLPTATTQWTIDGTVQADVQTGAISHRLLAGVAYDRTNYGASIGFNFAGIGNIDYADRTADLPFGAVPALGLTQTDQFRTAAAYLQDEITLAPWLRVTAGMRVTQLTVRQEELALDTTYTAWTPRAAITAEAAPGLAFYASYSEGFRSTLNFTGNALPVPTTSRNLESGVKVSRRGFAGTAAVFTNTRRNVPTPANDPENPFLQVQTGEQRARGFEAEATVEPSAEFAVLGSYAYVDATVTEDNAIPVGDRLSRVPRHQGRVALRYRPTAVPALALGTGVTAMTSRETTLPNTIVTPGFAVMDLQAQWTTGPIVLAVNVQNLFNRQYFDPFLYLNQAQVIPGLPRAIFGSVRYAF